MPESWLQRLSTLPAQQPFTSATAADAGLSYQALRRLTEGGVIRRLVQGVYVEAGVADSLGLRCAALRLVVPADAFVCDHTAAWLHAGDAALAPNDHLEVPPVSAFRPSEAGRLRNKITASGEREIRPRDLITIDGLTVTTQLRTAVDLGRLQRTPDLRLHGMDSMLRLGTFSREQLTAEVPRFNRRRGIVMLRILAPLADGGAESFGESALRWRWHSAGLPRPRTQIPVIIHGREVYRLDMGLEDLLFASEYDGERWHGEAQAERDEGRRRWLRDERNWMIEALRKKHTFGPQQDAERMLRVGFEAARARAGLRRTYFV